MAMASDEQIKKAISERQASCVTYDVTHGKVGEVVVTPEMVAKRE